MSDPTDATTFVEIAEHVFDTNNFNTYQELTFIIPANVQGNYVAIMVEAATSSRSYNGVYIDDITIADIPSCVKPSGLEWVSSTTTTATTIIYKRTLLSDIKVFICCLTCDAIKIGFVKEETVA